MDFKSKMKISNWNKVIFLLGIGAIWTSVVKLAIAQTPSITPEVSLTPAQQEITDVEWTKRVFQKLLFSLSDEEILILQKQLKLTDDQKFKIQNLNNSYKLQRQLWKEMGRLSMGEISTDENTKEQDSEKEKNNYANCLLLAKQLRDSLGAKDIDFLAWISDELFLRVNVSHVSTSFENPTPEDIASTFIQKMNENKNVKVKKTSEQNWWFEKRALYWACIYFEPTGKGNDWQKAKTEVDGKRKEVLGEMMAH